MGDTMMSQKWTLPSKSWDSRRVDNTHTKICKMKCRKSKYSNRGSIIVDVKFCHLIIILWIFSQISNALATFSDCMLYVFIIPLYYHIIIYLAKAFSASFILSQLFSFRFYITLHWGFQISEFFLHNLNYLFRTKS